MERWKNLRNWVCLKTRLNEKLWTNQNRTKCTSKATRHTHTKQQQCNPLTFGLVAITPLPLRPSAQQKRWGLSRDRMPTATHHPTHADTPIRNKSRPRRSHIGRRDASATLCVCFCCCFSLDVWSDNKTNEQFKITEWSSARMHAVAQTFTHSLTMRAESATHSFEKTAFW